MHAFGTSTPSATIVSPFPGSPEPGTADLRVHPEYHMTAADLRVVRNAVIRFYRPWFAVEEDLHTDPVTGYRWSWPYIGQIAGPTIANFFICRKGLEYEVSASDGTNMIGEWDGFLTVADAAAAIWECIAEHLEVWSLAAA